MHATEQEEIARRVWNEVKPEHLPVFDECGRWYQQQLVTQVYDILVCANAPAEDDAFGQGVRRTGRLTEVAEATVDAGFEAVEPLDLVENPELKSGFEKPAGKQRNGK